MSMRLGSHRAVNAALEAVESPSVPVKRLQVNIPAELHKAFKKACVNDDREMTDVLIELVTGYLQK